MDDLNMVSGQPSAETPLEYKPGEAEVSALPAAAPARQDGGADVTACPRSGGAEGPDIGQTETSAPPVSSNKSCQIA